MSLLALRPAAFCALVCASFVNIALAEVSYKLGAPEIPVANSGGGGSSKSCPLYKFDIIQDFLEGHGNSPEANAALRDMYALSCWEAAIDDITAQIKTTYGIGVDHWNFDDILYSKLRLFFESKIHYHTYAGAYGSYDVYFDSSCKALDYDSVKDPMPAECKGIFYLLTTPISLIWKSGLDIDSNARVSKFPLDPRFTNGASLWKGSPDAPLLVYDPLHRGEITSAEQLFGNWTFGGQRSAVLGGTPQASPRPWKNGYEALSSLDHNRDGKLSGSELEPLGLWFDEGMDGVSEPGEVRRLDEVGVVAVYTQPDSETPDAVTGNMLATLGYERRVGDTVTRGASVDWFSEAAAAPEELYARAFLKRADVSSSAPARTDVSESLVAADYIAGPEDRTLTGAWRWRFAAIDGKSDTGAILLKEDEKGMVSGVSYLEMGLGQNPAHGRMASMHKLSGRRLSPTEYVWELRNQRGERLESKIVASPEGEVLSGTAATVSENSSGSKRELTYSFVAEKIRPEKRSLESAR